MAVSLASSSFPSTPVRLEQSIHTTKSLDAEIEQLSQRSFFHFFQESRWPIPQWLHPRGHSLRLWCLARIFVCLSFCLSVCPPVCLFFVCVFCQDYFSCSDVWRAKERPKTYKRLKERFLIGRNRTKRASFGGSPLFQATYNVKTFFFKTINSTYLVSVGCGRLAEGIGWFAQSPKKDLLFYFSSLQRRWSVFFVLKGSTNEQHERGQQLQPLWTCAWQQLTFSLLISSLPVHSPALFPKPLPIFSFLCRPAE